jgi:hypothetical protein
LPLFAASKPPNFSGCFLGCHKQNGEKLQGNFPVLPQNNTEVVGRIPAPCSYPAWFFAGLLSQTAIATAEYSKT